jgi:hypothetical protein
MTASDDYQSTVGLFWRLFRVLASTLRGGDEYLEFDQGALPGLRIHYVPGPTSGTGSAMAPVEGRMTCRRVSGLAGNEATGSPQRDPDLFSPPATPND